MPRTCSVCRHLERAAIDTGLLEGTHSLRTLADRWGPSPSALRRHKEAHIPAALARVREAQELARADNLVGHVRSLYRETQHILERAKAAGDLRSALLAVDKAGRILALQAKLLGELEKRTAQAPTATEEIGYIVWVREEDGEELGLTREPPFIADGDHQQYITTLRRMRAFTKAKEEGRRIQFTGPSLSRPGAVRPS